MQWFCRLCPQSLVPNSLPSAESDEFELLGELPSKELTAALPVLADRVKLPAAPAFRPQAFMDAHTALSQISLQPHEPLLFAGSDFRDCFYQFCIAEQCAVRNLIVGDLSPAEAAAVFSKHCSAFLQPNGRVRYGLSSLAMGDSSACNFAQASRLGVLLQAEAVYPGEALIHASPPPRGLLSVGLVIDDLVIIEKVLSSLVPAI